MTDTLEQDPAAIERDIRRTQDDMSRTIDRIGDQLTPRNIFNALLDKADENDIDARTLLDGARRNPIALGLIAAGAIWLISDKDSKFPSLPHRAREPQDGPDIHHRDYVTHMSAVELRDGEDDAAYQRRRDQARANYFMLERRHDEDEQGFRQRLDDFADRFREKRQAWADSSARAAQATGRQAAQGWDKAQGLYAGNPLVGGLVAAAIGAAVGAALPVSRAEQDALGELGEQARSFASEQKDSLTDTLREKKDELVGQAQDRLQDSQAAPSSAPSAQQQGQAGQQGQQAGSSFSSPSSSSSSSPGSSPSPASSPTPESFHSQGAAGAVRSDAGPPRNDWP
ncbi:MAG TPA: DUF3618 domain-containing protein [Sphingobium sp.]|nr:DUF3618 domain-containing protein [Sphingobium sp.]